MHRIAAVLALSLVLSACGADRLVSPTPEGPWRPLSRVTVHNQHPAAVYLRANWLEGMEQTSVIPVGDPVYISGSIGGAFPATIEILDADCNVIIGRLADQPWDMQAVITVSATGMTLDPITSTGGRWNVAETVDRCRTKPNLP